MNIINRRSETDPLTAARERRHGRTRHFGLLLGAAAAAALVAGCGGGSSNGGNAHINTSMTTSTTAAVSRTAKSSAKPPTQPSMLAFAKCMRAHGVPDYPDPKHLGQTPATHTAQPAPSGGFTANPNSPAYQTASNDCKSLAVASPVTPAQANQLRANQLKFAVCMRAHGVSNFPDPTSTGEIGNDGAISGVNQNPPVYQNASKACSKFPSLPALPRGGPPTTS